MVMLLPMALKIWSADRKAQGDSQAKPEPGRNPLRRPAVAWLVAGYATQSKLRERMSLHQSASITNLAPRTVVEMAPT